jgi:hypothetical protein
MSYNNAIPQAGDNPSQSQSEILANFQQLDACIAVNHVQLTDASQGKHKFMQMPEQSAAPTTAANEGALYTKETSAITELFFRRESDGSELQMTGAFSAATNGYITFPGGLIMQWGNAASLSNGSTVTFPIAFASACYGVQVTVNRSNTSTISMYVNSVGTTTFKVATDGSGREIFWLAVGK